MNTKKHIIEHNPDLEAFINWKKKVGSGKLPLTYQPILNELTTDFQKNDHLSEEARFKEPVERNTLRQVKRLQERLSTSIKSVTRQFREIEAVLERDNTQLEQSSWDIIEQIEHQGVSIQRDYSEILNLAAAHGVSTRDMRRDFELFESALLIRDEVLSIQTLPGFHAEHLKWRQVSIISFFNSAQKVLRDIEAEHNKSLWRRVVEFVVDGGSSR